jgi:uncharacterized protein YjbJ (UPF0337 family)
MADPYNSGTENAIGGTVNQVKGAVKKAAGALTGDRELADEGGAQAAEGAAMNEDSQRQAETRSAKDTPQRDTLLGGGEGRPG